MEVSTGERGLRRIRAELMQCDELSSCRSIGVYGVYEVAQNCFHASVD